MNNISSAIFPDKLGERPILRVDSNHNQAADQSDPVLVRRTRDGWAPAQALESSIDRRRMADEFGLWRDVELSHVEEEKDYRCIDRPLNQKADDDEVYVPKHENRDRFSILGGEIVKDGEGRLTYHQQLLEYPPFYEVGHKERLKEIAYNNFDSNWLVAYR